MCTDTPPYDTVTILRLVKRHEKPRATIAKQPSRKNVQERFQAAFGMRQPSNGNFLVGFVNFVASGPDVSIL